MVKCTAEDMQNILDYIGDDYGECLYLYIDLLKYGVENEHINVWCQKQHGEMKALILQYYTGIHFFSRSDDFEVEPIVNLIKMVAPTMICGMKTTLNKLKAHFPSYALEIGLVGKLTSLKLFDIEECYRACENEIFELAQLLAEDESLGKPYGFELLYKQLLERYNESFGRNYIFRDNRKIVATASTYAEQKGIAVISGVLVHPNYRGKGLSKNILSAICKNLIEEQREVFSYYYRESAAKMHEAVGFKPIGEWAKLVRM